jgi:hypothetical protein
LAGKPGNEVDADPVVSASIDIAATPEAVYRLLDPTGSGHRWGLRGDRIVPVDGARRLFRLIDHRMPDDPFLLQVEDVVLGATVATTTFGEGGQPIGALAKSASRYDIEPAPGGCRVTLRETPTFLEGLSASHRKRHRKMLAQGVATDLEKLKAEAETAAA